jgi:hypothetical protein
MGKKKGSSHSNFKILIREKFSSSVGLGPNQFVTFTVDGKSWTKKIPYLSVGVFLLTYSSIGLPSSSPM